MKNKYYEVPESAAMGGVTEVAGDAFLFLFCAAVKRKTSVRQNMFHENPFQLSYNNTSGGSFRCFGGGGHALRLVLWTVDM